MTRKTRETMIAKILGEFEDADLGDPRRDERLLRLGMLAAANPRGSFPKIARSRADLEGAYRLLQNEHLDFSDVLQPHVGKTIERAREAGLILALHDTTEATFRGVERAKRLGSVTNGASGFFIHTTMAVTADGTRNPLGILGMRPHARPAKPKHQKRKRAMPGSKAVMASRRKAQKDKESDRWRVAAIETQEMLQAQCECIHVMDREGDNFSLFASMLDGNCRFVVRAKHDRVLEDGLKLWTALDEVDGRIFREVTLSRRRFINQKGAHPARSGRMASLELRARRVIIPRPEAAQSECRKLTVWAVQVYEPNPPSGEPAVEWTLLTSEPIKTFDDATRIVDWYRARWLIEEYFKCLKTGCAYEERQLESMETLLKALALFAPIAWSLLSLRTQARETPEAPADSMFTHEQLRLLRAISVRHKVAQRPTIRDALLAIAGLGGHLKNNGDPGWQTLAEGYREFLAAERGWSAARVRNL